MEVTLLSIFSAIIILIAIYSMVKVLIIAKKRSEITTVQYKTYVTITIASGLVIATVLPFAYNKLMEIILFH
ncbi:hypothetical protein N780_04130 [Pontibacillus chungwhensis BH030062]|uniref:DUF1146 domain-containing protein n=1 Tax=Pontibacillus chungwhensis BH030062 TaxID=1385513 RepID=A0A0A2UVP8_9BACI|nr:hypothetical protein N780_04130 [Pontibacillus chungwhensis BH030062]